MTNVVHKMIFPAIVSGLITYIFLKKHEKKKCKKPEECNEKEIDYSKSNETEYKYRELSDLYSTSNDAAKSFSNLGQAIRGAVKNSSDVFDTDAFGTPYIIANEEYGERDCFELCKIILYADYILATEDFEIIQDPVAVFGLTVEDIYDEVSRHGNVCIRDESELIDYDIIYSNEDYYDSYAKEEGPID